MQTLGSTGLPVSQIGFGMAALGRPGYITLGHAEDLGGQYDLLERHAARLSTTIDALALAAVLAQPWADVVLSGAATEAQLASNLQALQVRWDEQAAALAAIAESPQGYWGTRKRLPWA